MSSQRRTASGQPYKNRIEEKKDAFLSNNQKTTNSIGSTDNNDTVSSHGSNEPQLPPIEPEFDSAIADFMKAM